MKKFLVAFLVIGSALFVWRQFSAVDAADTSEKIVMIQKGSSVESIARTLEEMDLIRSPFFFRMYARFSGVASSLQAGSFRFSKSLSASEILSILHSGGAEQISVTIPEGYTVADIDALLASKGLGKPGDIMNCAFHCDFSSFDFLPKNAPGTEAKGYGSRVEGYLFPETYALSAAGYVPKFFLERMLTEFRKRVQQKFEDDIHKSGHTLSDIVILASLVEEEARHEEERATVAGILWKRLKNGIVLGVDATTRYETKKRTEPLTKVELDTATPYNTRRKQGLPPSPIANPGESAIRAALLPKDSVYWYYLHGKDGVIHYAVTSEEHTKNKFKYLR